MVSEGCVMETEQCRADDPRLRPSFVLKDYGPDAGRVTFRGIPIQFQQPDDPDPIYIVLSGDYLTPAPSPGT